LHLSPLDPLHHRRFNGIAFAHFIAGRYDEAVSWCEKRLREFRDSAPALRLAAACYGVLDRSDDARQIVDRLREVQPYLTIGMAMSIVSFSEPGRTAYATGLRKAGLPEG
jgi:adenylate cyclase